LIIPKPAIRVSGLRRLLSLPNVCPRWQLSGRRLFAQLETAVGPLGRRQSFGDKPV
jgi:hypothetical protein